MTCADVTELLDPFVDAELPAPMLLAVALPRAPGGGGGGGHRAPGQPGRRAVRAPRRGKERHAAHHGECQPRGGGALMPPRRAVLSLPAGALSVLATAALAHALEVQI